MNNELIQLITVTGYKKEGGFKTGEDISAIEIFAAVKSVGRTEYYEALRSGMDVKIIFVVDQDDFNAGIVELEGTKIKPSRVIYDDTTYLIKRTYRNNFGFLEMTCAEVE